MGKWLQIAEEIAWRKSKAEIERRQREEEEKKKERLIEDILWSWQRLEYHPLHKKNSIRYWLGIEMENGDLSDEAFAKALKNAPLWHLEKYKGYIKNKASLYDFVRKPRLRAEKEREAEARRTEAIPQPRDEIDWGI
jgi:hypothetical protein